MSQTCLTRAEPLISTRDRLPCDLTLDPDLDMPFIVPEPFPVYTVPLDCSPREGDLVQLLVTDQGFLLVTDQDDQLIAGSD